MRNKLVWLVVGSLMVLALVLASCGPAAVEEEGKTITGKVVEKEEKVVEEKGKEVVAPVKEGPQYGGTLVAVYGSSEPQSWDPVDATWYTNPVTSLYFETFLIGDLDRGPRGTNEYSFHYADWVPENLMKGLLAESWEWEDELTQVWHLRKGVMFTDKPGVMSSRELTADDVVYCRDRYYEDPRNPPSDYLESVVARDKYTVVYNYKKFNADWANSSGCGWYTQVYPHELVEAGIKDWKNAVGTGPFILDDYVAGASVTYVRNPIYYGTATIDGKEYKLPFVDRVEWPIIPDESTRLSALRTGKIDIGGASWKYRETLEQTNPELIRIDWLPIAFTMMGLRMDNPDLPWADKNVRRAMNMAIDREGMIESLWKGNGVIINSPYAMGWPKELFTPMEELPESARELYSYKPDKAKQLLAEAGYPNGFKCHLDCGSTASELDTMSMIVSYWANVGIECEIRPHEYGALLGMMMGHRQEQILETGKYVGTPLLIMDILSCEGMWNAACFWPEEWEEKIDTARQIFDRDERWALLKQLNVELIDECPYIWLPYPTSSRYHQPWVKNYYGEYSVGAALCGHIYAHTWIDQDLKKEMTGRR